MPTKTMLVISDPPHGIVKEEIAASTIGLPANEARLKIGFGAPEILAAADPENAAEVTITLKAAGLRVEMRDSVGLRRIPWPTLVSAFDFADDVLRLSVQDGEVVEIPYSEPLLAVHCEPPVDFTPPADWAGLPPPGTAISGPGAADVLEWIPHLDLYYERDGEPWRFSIEGDTMVAVVDECRSRFTDLTLDARLDGVRPRRRFVPGEAGFDADQRKRYAFGTLLLRHALESVSPELRDLTQFELGSRLAYLLARRR